MHQLRAATAERHARLERRLDIASRLESAAAYADLLGRLYGFYRPLEARLAAAGDLGVTLVPRAPLLAADLRALGRDGRPLPLAERLPDVSTRGRALGVLYVLEGATLGGAVIARMARRRLGVTPAFFGAGGAEIGARWRAFGAAVDAFAGGTAPVEMRLAAAECFAALEAWLCPG